VTVHVASTQEEVSRLTDRWSALADAAGSRHYAQPFWCMPWWRHRGRGELHVAFVENDEQLVALAPLYSQRILGVEVLRFLGSEFSQVSEVLVADGHHESGAELWRSLFSRKRCVLDLRGFRQGSQGLTVLREQMERGPWSARLDTACPVVATLGSWETYLGNRKQALGRKLRRAERFIERDHLSMRVDVVRDRQTLAERWDDIVSVFNAAERAHPRLNFFAEPYVGFTSEMLEECADQSRLGLYLLYLDDRPVATALMYRSGTTLCYSGPRFDPDHAQYSLGHLVLRSIIKDAFEGEISEVDLLWGDTPYKREWSTGSYEALAVSAAHSRRLHLLQTLAEEAASSTRLSNAMHRLPRLGPRAI
jgi:CelD/BcsL family acetyltransferase involved in cellulose biosynthesis